MIKHLITNNNTVHIFLYDSRPFSLRIVGFTAAVCTWLATISLCHDGGAQGMKDTWLIFDWPLLANYTFVEIYGAQHPATHKLVTSIFGTSSWPIELHVMWSQWWKTVQPKP